MKAYRLFCLGLWAFNVHLFAQGIMKSHIEENLSAIQRAEILFKSKNIQFDAQRTKSGLTYLSILPMQDVAAHPINIYANRVSKLNDLHIIFFPLVFLKNESIAAHYVPPASPEPITQHFDHAPSLKYLQSGHSHESTTFFEALFSETPPHIVNLRAEQILNFHPGNSVILHEVEHARLATIHPSLSFSFLDYYIKPLNAPALAMVHDLPGMSFDELSVYNHDVSHVIKALETGTFKDSEEFGRDQIEAIAKARPFTSLSYVELKDNPQLLVAHLSQLTAINALYIESFKQTSQLLLASLNQKNVFLRSYDNDYDYKLAIVFSSDANKDLPRFEFRIPIPKTTLVESHESLVDNTKINFQQIEGVVLMYRAFWGKIYVELDKLQTGKIKFNTFKANVLALRRMHLPADQKR